MNRTVVGLFGTLTEAQQVVADLVKAGFKRDQISLVANDPNNEYAQYLKTNGTSEQQDAVPAGKGAGFGAVVGALTGVLVGVGALAIPGIGPVLAAGPILAGLTGGTVGAVAGAVTGGVVGGLVKSGMPEEEAQYYAEGVRRGGTLVTVGTDDQSATKAVDLMNRHNAIDVVKAAQEWKNNGWKGYDPNAKPYTDTELNKLRLSQPVPTETTGKEKQVVPVVEEKLEVGKRQV